MTRSLETRTEGPPDAAGKVVELPVLVAGERMEPGENALRVSYQSGLTVVLHQPTVDDARRMVSVDREPLRELSIDDLTIFFDRVRENWTAPGSRWRELAIELGSATTGYSTAMTKSDVDYLGHTLTRSKQYDFIETDLGDPGLLDEWRPVKAVYTRCWPKGLIAHVMVGNVPLASLFTIYRSLITKNLTVAKLPKRDVASALCFANCIYETDPDHPVTRALSVLYWEPESEVEEVVLASADVVTAWGRGETIDSLRARLGRGTEFIEFGPKRSLAIVLDTDDVDRLAVKLAFDIAVYDQEACFSSQEIFVHRGVPRVASALADALARFEDVVPRRALTPDVEAHIQRARLEAVAEGWEVFAPAGTDWTVVVTDGPAPLPEHPLARFVYVHPIRHVDEALATVDRNVQTVSFEPWSRLWEVADPLTAEGADRIVQVGRMSRFRPGFVHDGFHPMRKMVRWVTVERPIALKYRYTDVSPEEYDRKLYGPLLPPASEAAA